MTKTAFTRSGPSASRYPLSLLAAVVVGMGAACQVPAQPSDVESAASPDEGSPSLTAPSAETAAHVPNPGRALEAQATSTDPVTTACATGNARAFIQAIGFSSAAASRFLAPSIARIEGGRIQQVSRAAYGDLPIAIIDYGWVTRASARRVAGGQIGNLESVGVEINQSSDNRIVVEWVPVTYEASASDAQDAEPIPVPNGPGGALLFRPTSGCWELIEDRRG